MSLLEQNKSYKPFSYPWAVEYATQHERIHWIEDELELQTDVNHWKSDKLSKAEKNHITQILRLFTQTDVAVGTNYLEYYIPKFKNNEIRAMLTAFASREFIHQRAYALLNDTLGLPEEEFAAFLEYTQMSEKLKFMSGLDVHSHQGTAMAIARSVLNEGMSLFSAFAMLLNYQRFGKMPGMCTVVEWSVRDESQHAEGMAKLFRAFCDEHPRVVTDEFKKDIYEMFRTAVKLEDKVIDLAYEMVTWKVCRRQMSSSTFATSQTDVYSNLVSRRTGRLRRTLYRGWKNCWEVVLFLISLRKESQTTTHMD
jgi:glutaredoxin 3